MKSIKNKTKKIKGRETAGDYYGLTLEVYIHNEKSWIAAFFLFGTVLQCTH